MTHRWGFHPRDLDTLEVAEFDQYARAADEMQRAEEEQRHKQESALSRSRR